MTISRDTSDWVGPVLQKGPTTDAIVAAIRELNGDIEVVDRGAYLRVLSPGRCRVTRAAVALRTGAPFRLPSDLELVMSSFKGLFEMSEDEAIWSSKQVGPK
jgi:toluene monooxygenase system protein D